MHPPLVSVLMSVHNTEDYVANAIESILTQTLTDFEFIIVDDCSTDQTPLILNKYSDSRIIRLTNDSNLGLTKSLNIGISYCQGSYIARMDADDISKQIRLSQEVNYLLAHTEVCGVCSNYDNIDSLGNYINSSTINNSENWLQWQMLYKNVIAHSSMMINANLLKEKKYNEYFKTSQDYELWSRLLKEGYLIHVLSNKLVQIREHVNRISNLPNRSQLINSQIIIKANLDNFFSSNISPEITNLLSNPYLYQSSSFGKQSIELLYSIMYRYFQIKNLSNYDKELIFKTVLEDTFRIVRATKTNYHIASKLAMNSGLGLGKKKNVAKYLFWLWGMWMKRTLQKAL